MKTIKRFNWIILALGAWEVLSAFVFLRWNVPVAFWNAFIVGALILLLAILAQRQEEAQKDGGPEWAIAGVSLWLIVSPFMFGYDVLMPMAMWNDVIVGVVSLVLALRSEAILRKEVASQRS